MTQTTADIPAIIGFGGYARSGKDTAASILTADYGHRVLSYGTYVASLLVEVNPLVVLDGGGVERASSVFKRLGYEGAKTVPDFVRMLQDLGTAVNNRDPGFLSRLVLADVPGSHRAAITGVRSRAEIDAIHAVGGKNIWVTRPGVGPRNNHVNELSVSEDDFDVALANDGTVDDLTAALADALSRAHALDAPVF